jgi:hypothetical protein
VAFWASTIGGNATSEHVCRRHCGLVFFLYIRASAFFLGKGACHLLPCVHQKKKNRHPALRTGLTETQFRDFVCEDLDGKKNPFCFVLFSSLWFIGSSHSSTSFDRWRFCFISEDKLFEENKIYFALTFITLH